MKIIVLDGYAMNPGDLSWDDLAQLGDCTVHARTSPADILARADGAEILLTNKTLLDADVIAQLPACRYVGVLATGYNVVDVDAASAAGITVTNVPAYSTQSVAQTVFAHLLNLAMHTGDHSRGVREGKWAASPDFSYWDTPLWEVAGKTMGIIGLGRTGRATATIARAFGMEVLAHTRTPDPATADLASPVSLDDIFHRSDVVSLHCPLTPETTALVNAARLAMMKPTAVLINTSRGAVIDEQALADALNSSQIAGAGLDVMSSEPPQADNPLLSAKNCSLTPHQAWATREARTRLMTVATDNVRAFIEGQPQNVVNALA